MDRLHASDQGERLARAAERPLFSVEVLVPVKGMRFKSPLGHPNREISRKPGITRTRGQAAYWPPGCPGSSRRGGGHDRPAHRAP